MEQATKKTILIWVASVAGVLLAGAVGWLIVFNSQFRTYHDNEYRFTVKYPGAWQVFAHPQAGAAVAFVAPKETALDTFRENVNITIEDLPLETSSLKGLTDKITLQMTKVFPNVTIAQSIPIDFGGRKGHRVLFAIDKPDKIRILTVWTVKGADKAYIFTFMAAAKSYPTYLPLIEAMIKSFELN